MLATEITATNGLINSTPAVKIENSKPPFHCLHESVNHFVCLVKCKTWSALLSHMRSVLHSNCSAECKGCKFKKDFKVSDFHCEHVSKSGVICAHISHSQQSIVRHMKSLHINCIEQCSGCKLKQVVKVGTPLSVRCDHQSTDGKQCEFESKTKKHVCCHIRETKHYNCSNHCPGCTSVADYWKRKIEANRQIRRDNNSNPKQIAETIPIANNTQKVTNNEITLQSKIASGETLPTENINIRNGDKLIESETNNSIDDNHLIAKRKNSSYSYSSLKKPKGQTMLIVERNSAQEDTQSCSTIEDGRECNACGKDAKAAVDLEVFDEFVHIGGNNEHCPLCNSGSDSTIHLMFECKAPEMQLLQSKVKKLISPEEWKLSISSFDKSSDAKVLLGKDAMKPLLDLIKQIYRQRVYNGIKMQR